MYYIRERTKAGQQSYLITVRVIDYSGTPVEKSKTWEPQYRLTDKQLQSALKRVALSFEKEVEEKYCGRIQPIGTPETAFNDFAITWLAMLEKTKTPSYWTSATTAFEHIKHITEGYRLNDFQPTLIEELFRKIDSMKKTEYTVHGKQCLRDIVQRTGIRSRKLALQCGVSAQTLKVAIRGERLAYNSTTLIAAGLECEVEEIFDIKQKVVPYKSTYLEGMKKCIRNTLAYATKLGILKHNYAYKQYITYRHPDAVKIKAMSYDEAQRFMEACANEKIQVRLALTFLLLTGIRKGELCGLDWSDFDFENKMVHIRRQYEAVSKRGVVLKEPKTASSIREFELPAMLIELLQKYKVWYSNQKANQGDKWVGEDNLFIAKDGKRLHPTTIRNWMDQVLQKAGLPHYSVHSLRHTYITLMVDAEIPITTVSKRVGHSKSSTTLNVYTACSWEYDKEASEKLDEYFAGKERKKV